MSWNKSPIITKKRRTKRKEEATHQSTSPLIISRLGLRFILSPITCLCVQRMSSDSAPLTSFLRQLVVSKAGGGAKANVKVNIIHDPARSFRKRSKKLNKSSKPMATLTTVPASHSHEGQAKRWKDDISSTDSGPDRSTQDLIRQIDERTADQPTCPVRRVSIEATESKSVQKYPLSPHPNARSTGFPDRTMALAYLSSKYSSSMISSASSASSTFADYPLRRSILSSKDVANTIDEVLAIVEDDSFTDL